MSSTGDAHDIYQSDSRVSPRLRRFNSHTFVDPANDNFAHRIPFLKQLSLSYGEEQCQNAADLSVNLPPPKLRNTKRFLTIHEQEILSKEGAWRRRGLRGRHRVRAVRHGGPGVPRVRVVLRQLLAGAGVRAAGLHGDAAGLLAASRQREDGDGRG